MGAWDTGPFDNDEAADWCNELHEAHPAARAHMIRHALTVAAAASHLEHTAACAAIAAAAIVASTLPRGEPITSVYAPDFLTAGGSVELDPGTADLAAAALDRVLDRNCEWGELWSDAEADNRDRAIDSVTGLRCVFDDYRA